MTCFRHTDKYSGLLQIVIRAFEGSRWCYSTLNPSPGTWVRFVWILGSGSSPSEIDPVPQPCTHTAKGWVVESLQILETVTHRLLQYCGSVGHNIWDAQYRLEDRIWINNTGVWYCKVWRLKNMPLFLFQPFCDGERLGNQIKHRTCNCFLNFKERFDF